MEHPIRTVARGQGRSLTWLAREVGLSYGYFQQLLLPPGHVRWRPAPSGFYKRVARILGVPEREVHWPSGGTVSHDDKVEAA